ncbi:hypothetical protein GCM10027578_32290 [Spirosoma luteolum]|jgi:hypothetical protein
MIHSFRTLRARIRTILIQVVSWNHLPDRIFRPVIMPNTLNDGRHAARPLPAFRVPGQFDRP